MIKLKSNISFLWVKGVFYYCVALLILLFVAQVNHLQAQLLSLLVLLIYALASSGHTYSFILKDNSIEVRNELRPFFKKSFALDDVEEVEVKGVAYRGVTLVIVLKNKSKKYYAVTRIEIEELQGIVNEFKNYKKE